MGHPIEFLTTAQVAELTGWSVTTINRWALEGELPSIHKNPGRTGSYLFDRSVVESRVRRRDQAAGLVSAPAA